MAVAINTTLLLLSVCGRRMFPESRIVGGDRATFGKWPWQGEKESWSNAAVPSVDIHKQLRLSENTKTEAYYGRPQILYTLVLSGRHKILYTLVLSGRHQLLYTLLLYTLFYLADINSCTPWFYLADISSCTPWFYLADISFCTPWFYLAGLNSCTPWFYLADISFCTPWFYLADISSCTPWFYLAVICISLRQWRTSTYLHKCGAALLNENWAITAAHCVEKLEQSFYLHKCGAALLNENWAITAAHCVEKGDLSLSPSVPPSDLLLRLGEHDLSSEDEPYGYQERRVQIVASHPQFDHRTFEYDLALLRFYEPVVFQPNIVPVCVPQDDTNFVGRTAYVTGWGRLYEASRGNGGRQGLSPNGLSIRRLTFELVCLDGPLPSVLQEVSVPVINNTVCETMYRSAGYIEHIPEIFICAGWRKGGFDSCEQRSIEMPLNIHRCSNYPLFNQNYSCSTQGDSGGPMVIQRPDKRWLLAGVISWGIGCAEPNQPGVYTRISEFRDWINQILQF
uniref:Peptidase S1 domain-containing protein n=1 Tax=Timema cristinae TaxID=61476 RepID=A0A7R9CYD6_TIMCR|nr:unnamed protein product [Timema cristinae]